MDDAFLDNPKVLLAGPLATHLYFAALVWCNHALYDGWIPDYQLRRLVDWNGIAKADQQTGELVPVDPAALALRLVEVGLWDRVNDGYMIHDYEKYQPESGTVLAKRDAISKKRSEAGKKGAAKRWGNGKADLPIANAKQSDGNTHSPVARSPLPESLQAEDLTTSLTASSTAVVTREESDDEVRAELDRLKAGEASDQANAA